MAIKLPLEPRASAPPEAGPGPGERPEFALIRELAALLNETGLSEIELGEGPQRVRVARNLAVAPAATPPGQAGSAPAPGVAVTAAEAVDDLAMHPGAVISPMVGAAYLAPEPGAKPFAAVGDEVAEGQTLLIVEAMKTMNPIRAHRGGRLTRVMVENGAPVEFGEVLMLIE